MKLIHEFRDPVHGFIKMSSYERMVIDSWPFQRLRDINQLAMTYLLYHGATHKRFEHSLGVMHLSSEVFDVITEDNNYNLLPEKVKNSIPQLKLEQEHWRKTLRMAGLCHDLGHLPFSHANEELLPTDYTHERMTWDIIHGPDLTPIWEKMHLNADEIGKLALGPREMGNLKLINDFPLSTLESLLSEIIVGDAFGVDRMDYLLRDSHHLGVNYGLFDIKRILQGLRIIYNPPQGDDPEDQSWEPVIGVEHGTLQAAAALLWARYSIFSQVYFHHIRRIYDIHLKEFMNEYYKDGYPVSYDEFLSISDCNILDVLHKSLNNSQDAYYIYGKRLLKRNHFKCIYHQTAMDVQFLSERGDMVAPSALIGKKLSDYLGDENIRVDTGMKRHKRVDFPVVLEETSGRVLMASQEMPTINSIPNIEAGYVFVHPEFKEKALDFINKNKNTLFD